MAATDAVQMAGGDLPATTATAIFSPPHTTSIENQSGMEPLAFASSVKTASIRRHKPLAFKPGQHLNLPVEELR
jgi:hypothetical protein